MFIVYSSLRNVRSKISWEGPSFTDCINSYWVWNWFSLPRCDTYFCYFWIALFFWTTVFLSCFKATRDTPFLVDTLVIPLRYTNKTSNFAHRLVVGMTKQNSPFFATLSNSLIYLLLSHYSSTFKRFAHSTLLLSTRSSSPGSVYFMTFLRRISVNIIKPSCYRSRGINSLSGRLIQGWKYFLQNAISYNHENRSNSCRKFQNAFVHCSLLSIPVLKKQCVNFENF